MAFGSGLNIGFQAIEPQDENEMRIVLSIGNEYAKKFGKPTPEVKAEAEAEMNRAITEHRRGGKTASLRDPLASAADPNNPDFLGTARPDPSGVFNVRPQPMGMEGHDHAKMLREQAVMDMPSSPPMSSSRSFSSSTSGMDVAKNLIDPLMQHDFSTDLMVNPEQINPDILQRRKSAYEAADDDFGFKDFSTFDKVAGGAGILAAALGAAGVGGRRGRGPLGAVSKYGIGRALSSPDRFAADRKRKLRNELGATQADVDQYTYDNSANQDLYGRGYDRAQLLRGLGRDVQSGRESERMAGMGSGGGSYPKFSFEQMLTDAIRNQNFRALSQIDELYKGKTLGQQMAQAYEDLKDLKYQSLSVGGARWPAWMIPRGDDGQYDPTQIPTPTLKPNRETIRKDAGKLFHEDKIGALDEIGGELRTRFPEAAGGYGDWLLNYKKGKRPLSDIGDMLDQGTFGTVEKNWFSPDVITPDSTIGRMYDDVRGMDSLGFVSDYEQSGKHIEDFPSKWGLDPATQSAINPFGFGNQPPPNDGSMTEEAYARFVELWKTDPSIRQRWEEAQR